MKDSPTPPTLKTAVIISSVVLILAFLRGVSLQAYWFDKFHLAELSISFYNFYTQDTYWCLFAAITIVTCLLVQKVKITTIDEKIKLLCASRKLPWFLALVTGLFMCFGAVFIHGAYSYTLDEYFVEFQAVITLMGDLLAHYPQEFQNYKEALHPYFAFHFTDKNAWTSGYRPAFSFIWAFFEFLHVGIFTNAILSTFSILLIYQIAKRVWPEKPRLWGLAALLLATSPHFVFPAMTAFVWPGILFVNLLWLYLFISERKYFPSIALIVGFFAVGFHQIHAHLLFAAPFVLACLWAKQYKLFIYSCLTYIIALFVWIHWHEFIMIYSLGASLEDVGFFLNSEYLSDYLTLRQLPGMAHQFNQYFNLPYTVTNIFRFLAWLGLPLTVFFIASFFILKRRQAILNLCLLSTLFTLLVTSMLMPDGMHGWGYRYMQGTLGSVVLLAVFAIDRCMVNLKESDNSTTWSESIARYTAVLLILSLFVSFPLRSIQIHDYIKPKKDAWNYLRSKTEDIVLLDTSYIFFGPDLVRNDPYLRRRPLLMDMTKLSDSDRATICQHYDEIIVTYEDLKKFGLIATKESSVDIEHDRRQGCKFDSDQQ